MVDLSEARTDAAPVPNPSGADRPRPHVILLLTVVVVLVAAVGVTVWNRYLNQASASDPGTSCPTTVEPTRQVPLASIGIKRVALIGDSIMNQASCSVAESLARVGVETGRYAVGGSGLLSGAVDWTRETSTILASFHPDAVIAIFVGNYWPPYSPSRDGTVARDGSPEFYAAWQQRAVELSNEVRAAGASMYWVSPPPIQASPMLDHADRLFQGYSTIPGVQTIAAGDSLAGAEGQEVQTMTTCGKTEVVRTPDRIHLTDDGARIYGQEIAHLFTAQTGLLTSPKPC